MQQNIGAVIERGAHLKDLEGRAGDHDVKLIMLLCSIAMMIILISHHYSNL